LRVVERAGDFLAVARNERNRCAAVEQRDRRLDLLFTHAELFGDLSMNVCHANSFPTPPRPLTSPAAGTPLMDHRRLIPQGEEVELEARMWTKYVGAGPRAARFSVFIGRNQTPTSS
jgi:hypothetical protein